MHKVCTATLTAGLLGAFLCLGTGRLAAADWKQRFEAGGVARLRQLEEPTFWLQAEIHE